MVDYNFFANMKTHRMFENHLTVEEGEPQWQKRRHQQKQLTKMANRPKKE